MAYREYFDVSIAEKEEITAQLIDKELINVDISVIDAIHDRNYICQVVRDYFINNEIPTKVNATTFTTTNQFVTGSLVVYYNGIKEKYITENGTTGFTFPYDTLADDDIEVSYIKIV